MFRVLFWLWTTGAAVAPPGRHQIGKKKYQRQVLPATGYSRRGF